MHQERKLSLKFQPSKILEIIKRGGIFFCFHFNSSGIGDTFTGFYIAPKFNEYC